MNTVISNPADLNDIAVEYQNVIKAFLNRKDVQNGYAIGYHDNQDPNAPLSDKNRPYNVGHAFTTTGWCVTVSKALNNDNAFKLLLESRNAYAKLISIDIKEEFWGECYNGMKNSWHTAILVFDSGLIFIIDLTCGQFGNRYVGKFIWDFKTWERTFRSPMCKHPITDLNGNVITTYDNIQSIIKDDIRKDSKVIPDTHDIILRHNLEKCIFLDDRDINIVTDFFEKINYTNKVLYNGYLSRDMVSKIVNVNRVLNKFELKTFRDCYYSVLEFSNKGELLIFLKKLIANGCKSIIYMEVFKTMELACSYRNIRNEVINAAVTNDNEPHYLVFEFIKPFVAIDTEDIVVDKYALIPFGASMDIQKDNIFNGVKLRKESTLNPNKCNAIYVRL